VELGVLLNLLIQKIEGLKKNVYGDQTAKCVFLHTLKSLILDLYFLKRKLIIYNDHSGLTLYYPQIYLYKKLQDYNPYESVIQLIEVYYQLASLQGKENEYGLILPVGLVEY